MITVWKIRGKKRWLVGQYEGRYDEKNLTDVMKALDRARQDCPNGKLVAMRKE